jgi:hypothetical protein
MGKKRRGVKTLDHKHVEKETGECHATETNGV